MSILKWWEDAEQVERFTKRWAAVHVDRREMLKIAGAAGGTAAMAAVLAACGGSGEEAPEETETSGSGGAATSAATQAPASGSGATAAATSASSTAASGGGEGKLAATQLFRTNKERDPKHFDYNYDLYCDGDASVVAMLGQFTPDNDVVPDIAEKWEPSNNGATFTFTIRKEAKWSNGDPLTANDYEWSWKRQLDPATGAPYAGFLYDIKNAEAFNQGADGITADDVGVKAVDDYTLQVDLEGPAGYFPILASYISAAPAHRASVEQHGLEWTNPETFVGSGPFKLVQWDHDQLIVLEKNDQYWDAEKITLQRIERPVIRTDASQLAYENDEIDWHYRGQLGQLDRVQNDPKLSKEFVKYNLQGTWYLVPDPKMAPFDVKEVRLAMAHAVDRKTLVEKVLKGLGTEAYTFDPPGTPFFIDDTFEQYTKYDPEMAMELLKGTPYEGGKNWPKITLTHREEGDAPKAVADAMIQMFKQNLGMEMDHEVGEPKETYDRMYKHEIQLMWVRWYIDYPDANNTMYQVWYSKFTSGSRHTWSNDEYDQLVSDARGVTDQQERYEMYKKAQEIQLADGAAIYVYNPWNYGMIKPWVTNLPKNKDGEFTPAWNVFIRDYDYYKILEH